ncbi:hypothetical protein PCANC_25511 [Puccinia coronata f. sp. avenae]|uniref:Uncharacterized protein n=1 Tax=Puccinia coronata f. sp. avenae TaxID=200324 RepID=A0A2N5U999_9BASI|nr:hypothetical protein PCANC_27873 [Puccinia coronata f. sp. avenae]PLW34325.1 hypothetical protein PCANC_25511 [Puccinia coronata f. sp. avenae]
MDTNRKIPILAIHITNLNTKFWDQVEISYAKQEDTRILVKLLQSKKSRPDLVSGLGDKWSKDFQSGRFILLDGLLYRRTANKCAMVLVEKDTIAQVIITDRDPKFTSEFWRSLFNLLGTQLSFCETQVSQTSPSSSLCHHPDYKVPVSPLPPNSVEILSASFY